MTKTLLLNRYAVLIALIVSGFLFIATRTIKKSKRYIITSYGAISDSTTVNTIAIQKTIDACMAEGGGIVVIPKGIFVSGAIFLKKNVDLLIEKDGVLKGSASQNDYSQIATRWEGTEMKFTSALVNADSVRNIKYREKEQLMVPVMCGLSHVQEEIPAELSCGWGDRG